MPTGAAVLDFGAFPGSSHASVAVTGQAGIGAGSRVEAYLEPEDTPDHTADEHMLETLRVFAGKKVAGVGFTIDGLNTSQLSEPPEEIKGRTDTVAGGLSTAQGFQRQMAGGVGTRIWGRWNVGWAWV